MATVEHPITRSELREELDVRLQHYATKADLAELKSDIGNLKAGVWRSCSSQVWLWSPPS